MPIGHLLLLVPSHLLPVSSPRWSQRFQEPGFILYPLPRHVKKMMLLAFSLLFCERVHLRPPSCLSLPSDFNGSASFSFTVGFPALCFDFLLCCPPCLCPEHSLWGACAGPIPAECRNSLFSPFLHRQPCAVCHSDPGFSGPDCDKWQ